MKRITVTLSVLLLASCSMLRLGSDLNALDSMFSSVDETVEEQVQVPSENIALDDEPIDIDPSEPEPEPTYDSEAFTQIPIEDAVTLAFEQQETAPEPMELPEVEGEPKYFLPEPSDALKIGDSIIPRWFVRVSAGMFFACLLTIGYISKQRKETYWRRGRD